MAAKPKAASTSKTDVSKHEWKKEIAVTNSDTKGYKRKKEIAITKNPEGMKKMRSEAHDNSFITKLYRPADRYVKNLVKQTADVVKEYSRDSDVNDRARFSHGADQAAAKRQIAARAGRPNQTKEALAALVGKAPAERAFKRTNTTMKKMKKGN